MIFFGDFAAVDEILVEKFDNGREGVVVNLEGALAKAPYDDILRKSVLFNTDKSLDFLRSQGTVAVTVGNNHYFDLGDPSASGDEIRSRYGFALCGAGRHLEEAQQKLTLFENGRKYILLSFCWDVTGAGYAAANRGGVNPLTHRHVAAQIGQARKAHPDGIIVASIHWGIELEKYPEPMHVQLAHLAIDCGADVIIGHHPHRIQPVEQYKGKYIFYSIGNYYIEEKKYFDGRMTYPPCSDEGIAVSVQGEDVSCFLLRKTDGAVRITNRVAAAEVLKLYPFPVTDRYETWFRDHRVKKKLIPVYDNYNHTIRNWCKNLLLKMRHGLICILLFLKLKKGRNTNEG